MNDRLRLFLNLDFILAYVNWLQYFCSLSSAAILDGTGMISFKKVLGVKTSCSLVITHFVVFTASRNINSMTKTKRSGEIPQPIMIPISSACHLVMQSLTGNFMKAESKYFIMISLTLPGKLIKSRAIRINWSGTDMYALATSSQITCGSVLFINFWLTVKKFQIICECSRQRENPVIPPFWTDVFIHQKLCHTVSKNIFSSTLRWLVWFYSISSFVGYLIPNPNYI